MEEQEKLALTRAEYDADKANLEERIAKRSKIVDAIATARAHGDLSENAEYHAAREEQGHNEAEIRRLEQRLENAEVIDVVDDGVVAPGKLVTIRHTGEEESETYLLGQRTMAGGEHDILTPESPIGQALVGHTAGQSVRAKTPRGELKVEILEVRSL